MSGAVPPARIPIRRTQSPIDCSPRPRRSRSEPLIRCGRWSSRRSITSGVSVPRPISRASKASQLGGARNTVIASGIACLTARAPARSTSMSTGCPAAVASRTGRAKVPDRCRPPWISAHSSRAPSSISCWKRAGRHEVVVDAVDFAGPRRPGGRRDAEMQIGNPLTQAADQRRLAYRGRTGQHHHASCSLGLKTFVASPSGPPSALTDSPWPVRRSSGPSACIVVGLRRSRTFPAMPCADDRRARAGGGSGRSPARS